MNKKIIMLVGITALTTMIFTNGETLKRDPITGPEVVMAAESNSVQNTSQILTATMAGKTVEIKQRSYIENIIYEAAQKNGLPEKLVSAVVQAESNFDPNCVGPDTYLGNAYGLMQLLPSTAKEVGVVNISDPKQNIEGGTKYLKMMIDRYSNKDYFDQNGKILTPYEMGVMAYNWGYPNLDNHIKNNGNIVVIAANSKYAIPKETYGYLMKIRSNYDFSEYYN